MRLPPSLTLIPLLLLFLGTHTERRSVAAGEPRKADAESERPPVTQLIEELGSESYATRVRAREMLQRLGLDAFDQLHRAQYHEDMEIAKSARRLVSSLLVSWWKESDPPAVRSALAEYGAQNDNERANRIDLLGELPGRLGLSALARLVRFEPSLRLSEKAALVLMRQPVSDDAAVRQQRSAAILNAVGTVKRDSADWLRVYSRDLADNTFDAERWRQLVDQQRQLLDSGASQVTTYTSVLELVRVIASRAATSGNQEEALSLAVNHIDLIPPQTRELIDASSWALDNNLHSFVLKLKERHSDRFSGEPVLLYGAAEALVRSGDADAAEKLAVAASKIEPLPANEEERSKLTSRELEELAQSHRVIGHALALRGLFRWAEREYRHVIDALDVDLRTSASTRVQLARMLGELQRHDEVVAVLDPLLERLSKDEKFSKRLSSVLRIQEDFLRSDREFHHALSLIESGRTELAAPVLEKAWDLSGQFPNIDILIAMYRLDAGEAWNGRVREILQRTIRLSETAVRNAEIRKGQMGPLGFSSDDLAQSLNQYAWLVSNTEGNYRKALQYSLRSLELDSDDPEDIAARLDTCARCYFAVGDLTKAIQTQRRALRLMPHSPPMKRQLTEFLEEAGDSAD